MKFAADLHIHSRFSRATSRSLDLPTLDYWAGLKGLTVLGAGDATHPVWLAELEEQLLPAEQGLYRLKPEFARPDAGQTRFMLTAEISSIYKQGDRVRKVHSLILLPNLAVARTLHERLDRIGNVKSDGRPILGLSAKDLLAICLDISDDIFFIPAHVWTPWFSLLGSKSGFDSVEECFEDLAGHIYALETGLSSDPPMNWRLSSLDPYVLVSNSDAHSADKLGREANLFDTGLSYPDMVKAMKKGGGFAGTIEFFPEEGKYHLDGHRKCNRRLDPEETRANGGLCPDCGKPVTVGVMSRVLDLADRPAGSSPPDASPFYSLIPLAEVLGEILNVGPKSKRVTTAYQQLLDSVGPELFILREAPLGDLSEAGGHLLAMGIERMRYGRVTAEGGYDGEYGRISLFSPGEKRELSGQGALFENAPKKSGRPTKEIKPEKPKPATVAPKPKKPKSAASILAPNDPLIDDLNPAQREAVIHGPGPLAIVAGPGTGKTTVLTRRAAWLIREGLARPENILGVTFTRQAAGEMASRLAGCLPFRSDPATVEIMTFHALGLKILAQYQGTAPAVLSEEQRLEALRAAAKDSPFKGRELLGLISLAKQKLLGPGDVENPELAKAYGRYQVHLAAQRAVDFDDLVVQAVRLLSDHQDLAEHFRRRFSWLLVDEYQDINHAQYALTRLLVPGNYANLTVIGDPDQAIYGFRGADAAYFQRFREDFPSAKLVRLTENFRSTDTILKASSQVIKNNPGPDRALLTANRNGPAKITTAALATTAAEAEYVVWQIESLLGGTSHFALDSGRAAPGPKSLPELSLADVAILYRLHALAKPLAEALDRAGLPYQQAGQDPGRETDDLDFAAEKINLLTMHAAKGLEFEVVFIVGLEDEVLPYHPPNKEPADALEERRLFFVALTRAKKLLYLTRAAKRTLYGRRGNPNPSPFLAEIEAALKATDRLPDKPVRPEDTQLSLF